MTFVYLMDPLESINPHKDTTLMLMVGAHQKGHSTYYVPTNGISLLDGVVHFKATKVIPSLNPLNPFTIGETVTLTQDQVHAVFIRPDPPFDERYLMNTWLLDHLPKTIAVINSPSGIRTVNEKVWSAQFKHLAPPTLISSQKDALLTFIKTHGHVIAKPANAFGGQSVFNIEPGSTNTQVVLETLSDRYRTPIILQRYIPQAAQGDKRILLLNGDFLGALLRVHAPGEHRNNFFASGKPAVTTLTARDQEIINTLRPYLQELKLYFVGIDILGDYLIEVNVTSPTCLQEINSLYNTHLEEKIIDFVEKLVQ